MEKLRETILEKCIKGDINLIRVKDPLGKKNEFVIKTLYHELMQAMVSLTKDLSVCKKTINILIEGEFLKYKKDLKNINISIFRKEHYTVRDKE